MIPRIPKETYRFVFVLEDRNFWDSCRDRYDPQKDLVLTFDFRLRHHVRSLGGDAEYIDHLADSALLFRYDFEMYRFFSEWHLDKEGKDIFSYEGIDFGQAFRIEIWNDITFHSRLFLNLRELKSLEYEKIFIGVEDPKVNLILSALSLSSETLLPHKQDAMTVFFFPIFTWNEERLHPNKWGLKVVLRLFLSWLLDGICKAIDLGLFCQAKRKNIFIFPYHPLRPILDALKRDRRIRVISDKYVLAIDVLKQRRLPIQSIFKKHKKSAFASIRLFNDQKHAMWFIDDFDMGSLLTECILERVSPMIPPILSIIDSINHYFRTGKPHLMITFSNIGVVNALMAQYCRISGIPVYLVINGLLAASYLDEGKEATSINAYGESIKREYFKDAEGVVCLGDPRMDVYALKEPRIKIERNSPTIVVGAAGFNNLELNSFLAYEFEFLNDVLLACRSLLGDGAPSRIILKVRPNGYLRQYEEFAKEYFPDLPIRCVQDRPMMDVLGEADLYISTYSQTLFEASCLGIPVIYYANHTEEGLHEPFDGKSELVTARSVDELIEKIGAFVARSPTFDAFLDRNVMEKYIGPLDGGSTQRNLDYMHSRYLKG